MANSTINNLTAVTSGVVATDSQFVVVKGGVTYKCDGADAWNRSGNIIFTNGAGIDFSAASLSTGTTTSEILDDYEEGTFTPVFADSAATQLASGFHDNQVGFYIKVGRKVTVDIYIRVNSLSGLTGSNTVRLYGLPFTAASETLHNSSVFVGDAGLLALAGAYSLTGTVFLGGTFISVSATDTSAGTTGLVVNEFSADGYIRLSATYMSAS